MGGALLVGALAGASTGGGLALVSGSSGVEGLVLFVGSAVGSASLALLLTIVEGMRSEARPHALPSHEPPDSNEARPKGRLGSR